MKPRPQVGKIILLTLLFLLVQYAVVIGVVFLMALIIKLIQLVPFLERIANWILSIIYMKDGSAAGIVVYTVPFCLSYAANMWLLEKLCDRKDTYRYVLRSVSIILFVVNVFFLVLNVISGTSFSPNIVFIIYSIILFVKSFKED